MADMTNGMQVSGQQKGLSGGFGGTVINNGDEKGHLTIPPGTFMEPNDPTKQTMVVLGEGVSIENL